MSVRVMTWVFTESRSRLAARLVLLAIADRANDEGADAWPSIDTLAAKALVHRRTAQECIDQLEKLGELRVEHTPGRTNHYTVIMQRRLPLASPPPLRDTDANSRSTTREHLPPVVNHHPPEDATPPVVGRHPTRGDSPPNTSSNTSGTDTQNAGARTDPPDRAFQAPRLSSSSRRDVAFPGRPPVPAALHVDLRSKLGGDEDEADARLRAWYGQVADKWADIPIGDDDWTFWRARFQEWLGTTRTAPAGKSTRPSRALRAHEQPGVWADIVERLQRAADDGGIGPSAARQWFGGVTVANDTGTVLTLALPSELHREFLARRYGDTLQLAAETVRPGTSIELFVPEPSPAAAVPFEATT